MQAIPLNLYPVPGRAGWLRTDFAGWTELEARVLDLRDPNDPIDFQIVCGALDEDPAHAIYLIENLSAIDLAREFRVGKHDGADETEPVCDALHRIFTMIPFRPYFVDSAGFKAKFARQISLSEANDVETILLKGMEEHGWFGTEGYMSEWSGEGSAIAETE